MKITEKRIQLDSRWFSPERDVSRTKGLHLSHVIDFIEEQEGKHEARKGGLSDVGHSYAAAGFMWERVLTRLIENNPTELWEWLYGRVLAEPDNPKVIRPGEQCLEVGDCQQCLEDMSTCPVCDGIGKLYVYMTPDGYHIDDQMLEEWKWTTKSSNNPITGPKFHRWLGYQIPCYLKALRLTKCRLRVYFARGNYTDGVPQWWEFILEYTQQEIDEIWECIQLNAIAMYKGGLV